MLWPVAVTVAVWLGGEFGRIAVFPETGSPILFPPYAVLAAALLLSPPRRWLVFLGASFAGHMLVDIRHTGGLTIFATGTEAANAVRALLVAGLWRRLEQSAPRFETLKSTAVFLGAAALLAPALAAIVGAAVTVVSGRTAGLENAFARVWAAWFLSNAVVGITVLPFVLVLAATVRGWRIPDSWLRRLEATAVSAGLAAGAVMLVGGIPAGATTSAWLYAPVPFLLWAAVRFGPGATAGALVVVTGSIVAGVMNGWGAFATRPSDTGVLSVYLFLTFTSVPCLLLAVMLKERAAALAALRAGQERYRLATNAGVVGVWDWRLDTNEIFVDPTIKAAVGYADHEIRNHYEDWFRLVHPEDAERALGQVGSLLATGEGSFDAEYRMFHKDGSVRWVLTRGVAVRETWDTPRRLVGTTTDITARKQAELARGEAEMALRDRQREVAHLGRVTMLGQLSGALTHELRQPLTAILSNAQAARHILAMRDPDLKDLDQILGDIISDDARAGEVIRRLNRLLKRGEPTFEQLDLSALVQDALDVVHGDLVERGVELTTELQQDLPCVSGDRVELQQVLINLVLNASDAMTANAAGDRGLIVGTRGDDRGGVFAYVADRGGGIPAPDIHHIFEPFVTTKPNGLGLGLAISRSIVLAHGGQLWATNNPDRGATFHLGLPTHRVQREPLSSARTPATASA